MKNKNYKPILFKTEMVQAILEGRKTQTRRIAPFDKFCTSIQKTGNGKYQEIYNNNPDPNKMFPGGFMAVTNIKSKFEVGNILWVRETFYKSSFYREYCYKADLDLNTKVKAANGWKPSLFMPKEACRIFLKVTNVRCERLNDISDSDAIAEGIREGNFREKARNIFYELWQSINAKKYPWNTNPWVWVYEFEKVEKPIDFL